MTDYSVHKLANNFITSCPGSRVALQKSVHHISLPCPLQVLIIRLVVWFVYLFTYLSTRINTVVNAVVRVTDGVIFTQNFSSLFVLTNVSNDAHRGNLNTKCYLNFDFARLLEFSSTSISTQHAWSRLPTKRH